jgi:hypothetical protein
MTSHEKAMAVENALAREFNIYIIGTAVVPDEVHGSVVTLYRTPELPIFACPSIRDGVKIIIKETQTRRNIPHTK